MVSASESGQMVATVGKNGTSVWYLLAKDEGHGFCKKKKLDFQFYATVMSVKKFLLGCEVDVSRAHPPLKRKGGAPAFNR